MENALNWTLFCFLSPCLSFVSGYQCLSIQCVTIEKASTLISLCFTHADKCCPPLHQHNIRSQWQCSIKGNVSHFVEMSSSDIHQLHLYFSGGWVNYGKRFILGDPLTNEAESRLYYIHVKGTSLCNNHHRWCLIFCRGTVRHVFSTVQWSWHFATVIYCMSLQRKSSANNTCAL